ncbi:MAG: hypothetical protein R3336_05715 [Phycisphaeraceae bacterium]|nr:hypothetical protein [Phycisphaeraceae bacterium]
MTGPAPSWQRHRALAVALVAYLVAAVGLVVATLDLPAAGAWTSAAALSPWLIAHVAAVVALSTLAWIGWRVGVPRGRMVIGLILLVGLGLRLALALGGPPALSDDLYRYVHDGATVAEGSSPWRVAPAEIDPTTLDPERAEVLEGINHPELVSVYQPTSLLVFAGLWQIHPSAWDPGGIITFRIGWSLVDLGLVALLMFALARAGRSPAWAALYAWHPLVLAEVAHSGHQEPLGLLLLVAGLVLAVGRPCRSWIGAGAALAAAGAVKPIAWPVAIAVAMGDKGTSTERWRRWLAALVAGLVAGGLLYGGIMLLGSGTGLGRLPMTLQRFVEHWAFNAPLMEWATEWLGRRPARAVAGATALLVLLGVAAWRRDPWVAALAWLTTAALVSSTVHPWYLLWPLALVPMRFSLTVWLWAAVVPLVYLALDPAAAWEVPGWVLGLEYGLVALGLIGDGWRACSGETRPKD